MANKISRFPALSLAVVAMLAILNAPPSTARAQGTAFTYQGRLNAGGSPVSGTYDFRFKLYTDAYGNNQAGATQLTNALPVSAGLFLTTIDFGPGLLTGASYWLEVDVRTNGPGAYTILSPLQALTPTPYAVFANTAGNFSGTVASANLSGTYGNALTLNNAGNSFSGAFTGSGANLTALNANNLTSGTVPLARLSGITAAQLDAATWQLATNGGNATLAIPQGMALIPAGTFTMRDTLDGLSDATPTTTITVSAFYMDINLVTYAQWQSVYYWAATQGYGFTHAGAGKAANHPVQTMDWYDCVKWCNARSQQAGLTPVYYTDAVFSQVYTIGEVTPYMNPAANGYRLPTEAEWEKAARGGLSGQRFPWGNTSTENLANYVGHTSFSYDLGPNGNNSAFTNGVTPYTSPVGYFAPNGYGLYDMAGNVFEWCWDWYGTPYGQPTTTNPTGPSTGSYRVLRGGAWGSYSYYARCAFRDYQFPDLVDAGFGFRCVRGH